MDVCIVDFARTALAAVEHRGPPELEYQTSQRLIAWRIRHGITPQTARTFGIHYTDPFKVAPAQHRVDFCVSFAAPVPANAEGVVAKTIPSLRCALARHTGSRRLNTTAIALVQDWLPGSGQSLGAFPMFFHYLNVGPDVHEQDMLTDVYLPLARSP
jgi:AraC family transcriptional regulator